MGSSICEWCLLKVLSDKRNSQPDSGTLQTNVVLEQTCRWRLIIKIPFESNRRSVFFEGYRGSCYRQQQSPRKPIPKIHFPSCSSSPDANFAWVVGASKTNVLFERKRQRYRERNIIISTRLCIDAGMLTMIHTRTNCNTRSAVHFYTVSRSCFTMDMVWNQMGRTKLYKTTSKRERAKETTCIPV